MSDDDKRPLFQRINEDGLPDQVDPSEGPLETAVGIDTEGRVILMMSRATTWIAMPPGDAMLLADMLIQNARKAQQ